MRRVRRQNSIVRTRACLIIIVRPTRGDPPLFSEDEYRYYQTSRRASRVEYEWTEEEGGGLENEERAKIMRMRRDGSCDISSFNLQKSKLPSARLQGIHEGLSGKREREKNASLLSKRNKKTPTFVTCKSRNVRARDIVNIASINPRGVLHIFRRACSRIKIHDR